MEQHSRASTEALARADRMLVEQAESMEQRVEEIAKRMQKERQMLEDQLKEEQQLVEDVDVSNRWMMERRREEELTGRLNSANGLVANTHPSSVGSQSEGFGRGTFREYGRCGLGSVQMERRKLFYLNTSRNLARNMLSC
jgi:hypothetical protein